jgi:hypothetical protein
MASSKCVLREKNYWLTMGLKPLYDEMKSGEETKKEGPGKGSSFKK